MNWGALIGFIAIMGTAAAIAGSCIWLSLFRKRVKATANQLVDDEIGADGKKRISIKGERPRTSNNNKS